MLRLAPLALLVIATAAAARPPIEVTRFTAQPTIAPGSAAPIAAPSESLEQRNNEDAVAHALAQNGFSRTDTVSAQYAYTVDVSRETQEPVRQHSPVSIGVGGATGGYGSGGALGLSFGLGGRHTPATVTRLSVQMRDRVTQAVVWEGRATTTDTHDEPTATVDRLASALFKDFPGVSGRTIKVR